MLSEGARRRWEHPRTVRNYFERQLQDDDAANATTGSLNGAASDASATGASAGRTNGRVKGRLPEATEALIEDDRATDSDAWQSSQYLKWGPFAHAWDVRCCRAQLACAGVGSGACAATLHHLTRQFCTPLAS